MNVFACSHLYLLQTVLCTGQVRGELAPGHLQLCEAPSQARTFRFPQTEQSSGFSGGGFLASRHGLHLYREVLQEEFNLSQKMLILNGFK